MELFVIKEEVEEQDEEAGEKLCEEGPGQLFSAVGPLRGRSARRARGHGHGGLGGAALFNQLQSMKMSTRWSI